MDILRENEALEWGKLRTGTVGISGTDYEPPVPQKEKTIEELKNILNDANASATDKALEAFTWGARGQFFWDGNKRTSLLLANKILVSSGAGIMTITDKYMEQFNSLLITDEEMADKEMVDSILGKEFEEHMLYIIHLIGTSPDMIINQLRIYRKKQYYLRKKLT